MVVRTLQALADQNQVDRAVVEQAIEKYQLHNVRIGADEAAASDE